MHRKLGEGGMGAVYLAKHVVLEKQVALKVLHGEYATRKDLVERLLHEARAAARIRHPHVVDITDCGKMPQGRVFFAMELLQGIDLEEVIQREGPLAWPRAKSVILQACAALQAAHDAGVIHRDLKPENIFLVNRPGHPDFVKVLDFGIAKLTDLEPGRRMTKTGMVFGTPEYMSPEQARGEHVDARADVYALGCVIYQMITGDVPFRGDASMGVLTKHLFENVPALATRTERKDLPTGFEDVLLQALEKDRDRRWASMNELGVAIEALDHVPGVAYHAPEPREPDEPLPVNTPIPELTGPSSAPQVEIEASMDDLEAGAEAEGNAPRSVAGTIGGEPQATPAVANRRKLVIAAALASGANGAAANGANPGTDASPSGAAGSPGGTTTDGAAGKTPSTDEKRPGGRGKRPPETKPGDTKPTETKPPDTQATDSRPPDPKPEDGGTKRPGSDLKRPF